LNSNSISGTNFEGTSYVDKMEVMIMESAFIKKIGSLVWQIAVIAIAQSWGFIRNPVTFFRKGYTDGDRVVPWKK
jgi:hypothetical protein